MSIEPKTDEALIDSLKKDGSMDSFKILYGKYKTKIYHYLYRLLGDRAEAEDCTHEVFIQLYQKAGQYKAGAQFSSWLYTMARNKAFDLLRKRKVRKSVSFDRTADNEDEPSLAGLLSDCGLDPAKAAESKEVSALVQEGIAKLDAMEKQLILLCDLQELSHKEVAEILGYSPETIAVKLYRARGRLAKILKIEDFF